MFRIGEGYFALARSLRAYFVVNEFLCVSIQASMFLYEAKVLEGEIDPAVRGGESFSGVCNLMMQMSDNLITVQETGKRPQFGLLF